MLTHRRPGEIYTYTYGDATLQLDANKKVQEYAWKARRRVVRFDVCHGAESLRFRIEVPAIRQGFLPDTISTDIHKGSVLLPRADMATTMSKFLNMGLTIEQIIERTTVNAARAIRRPDLGRLSEGSVSRYCPVRSAERPLWVR